MLSIKKQQEVLDLLEAGLSQRAIFRQTNIARATISAIAKRGEIKYAIARDEKLRNCYLPTLLQIMVAAARIRMSWTAEQRIERRQGEKLC